MTVWRAAASLAAPHRREENVPVMIFTPSRVINRFASLAAAVGSGASATVNTSFLPMTPPRSLITSPTLSYPPRCRLPSPACGPDGHEDVGHTTNHRGGVQGKTLLVTGA